jgi:ADP-ribosylglycohydrolase
MQVRGLFLLFFSSSFAMLLAPHNAVWPKMIRGAALGDALGFGVESQTPAALANVDFTQGYVFMRTGKFAINCGPGYVSDDTMETLVIRQVLQDNDGLLPDASCVLQALLEMYDREKARTNGVPRQGFGAIKDVGETPLEKRAVAIDALYAKQRQDGEYKQHLRGNAPVMRSLPLALCPASTLEANALINADATHPHPIPRMCSYLLAYSMQLLLNNPHMRPDVIIEAALELERLYFTEGKRELIGSDPFFYRQLSNYLKTIHNIPSTLADPASRLALTGNTEKGCPVNSMHTLGVALWLVRHYDGTWNYVLEALRIGGDVDTYMSPFVGMLMAADLLKQDQVPEWAWTNIEKGIF